MQLIGEALRRRELAPNVVAALATVCAEGQVNQAQALLSIVGEPLTDVNVYRAAEVVNRSAALRLIRRGITL